MRINAVNFGAYAHRHKWSTAGAARSLELMVERLNPSQVVLPVIAFQDTIISTYVDFESSWTVGDQEVADTIERLHAGGVKVILKPMVDVRDGTWRAHISFFDHEVPTEPTWAEWFDSYTAYQLHFARLAARCGAEMFVVGCEMAKAHHRESEWRALIADVRRVYPGPVTYNADKYQEDRISWWDACDLISSSGYYPPERWARELPRIEKLTKRFAKPFVFLEVGCRNAEGAVHRPNKHDDPGGRSDDDQTRYYKAMFEACEAAPFVDGYAIWDWPAVLPAEGEICYCPYSRQAEAIIRAVFDRTDPRSPDERRLSLPPPRFRPMPTQPRSSPVKRTLGRVRAWLRR